MTSYSSANGSRQSIRVLSTGGGGEDSPPKCLIQIPPVFKKTLTLFTAGVLAAVSRSTFLRVACSDSTTGVSLQLMLPTILVRQKFLFSITVKI